MFVLVHIQSYIKLIPAVSPESQTDDFDENKQQATCIPFGLVPVWLFHDKPYQNVTVLVSASERTQVRLITRIVSGLLRIPVNDVLRSCIRGDRR